jgi:tetratricopeptide (TPR) repeat protein
MDRILRVLALVAATAAFGLAASAGCCAPVDAVGGEPALLPPQAITDGPAMPAGEEPAEMPPAEMASPLAAAQPKRERSEQLEQVAQQADRRTRHGFDLAGRGAYFAARSEFLGGLKLLAEGLDTEHKTDAHGLALTAAMTAMKEAEDFLPDQSRLETGANLADVIALHATPVLKNESGNVSSMTALKCYFTFAQEQFAAAVGDEVAGSMALHALGKLHNTLAQKKNSLSVAAESKAMVFYQAALLACPGNFMAANDLGVLLAQCGHSDEARTILEHSLSLSPQSVTWHNLAVVYGQLGQTALARQADQEAAALQQAEIARRRISTGTANNSVVWIDSQTFAQTSGNTPSSPGAAPQPAQTQPAKTARPPSSAERMSWGLRTYH